MLKIQFKGDEYLIRFFHLKEINSNKPYATKAIIYVKDVSQEDGWRELEDALAYCHPNDNYSKLVGRYIAYQRLINKLDLNNPYANGDVTNFRVSLNTAFYSLMDMHKLRQIAKSLGINLNNINFGGNNAKDILKPTSHLRTTIEPI